MHHKQQASNCLGHSCLQGITVLVPAPIVAQAHCRSLQVDPLGKFRKFGRGGKDPEARSGHVESTVMFPMSKAGTPSLKPSVVTSCQAEDDAPDEAGRGRG